jgi:release factor glutamine methyltransferase
MQTAGMLARALICHYTNKTQEQFLADREMYVSDKVCDDVAEGVRRLLAEEPLAYILGEWDFCGMRLLVDHRVLIPRDDTCAVTELAIRQTLFLDSNPRVLDLCTGSGCIGLAIAHRVKDAKVTLGDLSQKALNVAKQNTALNHMTGRVRCMQVDATKPAPAFLGKFDMIISNPPYITGQEMKELPASVADFEPHMALYGGEDGLDFYRAIAENYTPALKPGGYLALEFGMGQGDDVCRILAEHGYTILERTRDYNDRERAVLAQYGRKEG